MCSHMEQLRDLFMSRFGVGAETIQPLSVSGSNRRYFRIGASSVSCVGVIGTDQDENRAFIEESRHFQSLGMPVPEVIAVSDDFRAYLQTDLGDDLLYDMIVRDQKNGGISAKVQDILCRTMTGLARLQFEGGRDLDYSLCYPEPEFSRRMVMFDLNYFKYCFLKPSGVEFNEVKLQDDFERLADELLSAGVLRDRKGRIWEGNTFMYRDFQSRNVMVLDEKPYFIDFQGGRRGPVHYDVASFVWHARSSYPLELKEKLLESYLDALSVYVEVDRKEFRSSLDKFILFRTLQVLGAYGFRGWVEQKAKFVTSIPAAVLGLREQISSSVLNVTCPYLVKVLSVLTQLPAFAEEEEKGMLTVTVNSFSFHKGVPRDPSGNGGGYVFDCRSIHNPGRYEPYKKLTGRDEPVIRFLEDDGQIQDYLSHVYAIVCPHVETYLNRGFSNLMISFGCTGGQHRSVYCAEHLAHHLAAEYPSVRIRLIHREQVIEETL